MTSPGDGIAPSSPPKPQPNRLKKTPRQAVHTRKTRSAPSIDVPASINGQHPILLLKEAEGYWNPVFGPLPEFCWTIKKGETLAEVQPVILALDDGELPVTPEETKSALLEKRAWDDAFKKIHWVLVMPDGSRYIVKVKDGEVRRFVSAQAEYDFHPFAFITEGTPSFPAILAESGNTDPKRSTVAGRGSPISNASGVSDTQRQVDRQLLGEQSSLASRPSQAQEVTRMPPMISPRRKRKLPTVPEEDTVPRENASPPPIPTKNPRRDIIVHPDIVPQYMPQDREGNPSDKQGADSNNDSNGNTGAAQGGPLLQPSNVSSPLARDLSKNVAPRSTAPEKSLEVQKQESKVKLEQAKLDLMVLNEHKTTAGRKIAEAETLLGDLEAQEATLSEKLQEIRTIHKEAKSQIDQQRKEFSDFETRLGQTKEDLERFEREQRLPKPTVERFALLDGGD
ncbi:MAG: hypothetical protein Q9168_007511 [Polycauliona sp. 1 TL-2023]